MSTNVLGGMRVQENVLNDPRKLAPNMAKVQEDRLGVINKRRSRFGELLRNEYSDDERPPREEAESSSEAESAFSGDEEESYSD